MEWNTLCFGLGVPDPSPTMPGKAAKRERTAGVTWHSEAAKPERRRESDSEPEIRSSVWLSKT